MSIKEKLELLGKNSIRLKIEGKETYKLGATRFGGQPDVPADFVWPAYGGESYDNVVKDRPLTFLAQFNCAELARFDTEHLLPDHGLLSFFYETGLYDLAQSNIAESTGHFTAEIRNVAG